MAQKAPLSVRLDEDTDKRLTSAAEKLRISKHQLAISAIEAAIEAYEKGDQTLVFPLTFKVTKVATSSEPR